MRPQSEWHYKLTLRLTTQCQAPVRPQGANGKSENELETSKKMSAQIIYYSLKCHRLNFPDACSKVCGSNNKWWPSWRGLNWVHGKKSVRQIVNSHSRFCELIFLRVLFKWCLRKLAEKRHCKNIGKNICKKIQNTKNSLFKKPQLKIQRFDYRNNTGKSQPNKSTADIDAPNKLPFWKPAAKRDK